MTTREARRLQRSRKERRIAGVCAGIAIWLGLDPIIPRVTLIVLTLVAGLGILVYVICWLAIPQEPHGASA